MPPSVSRLPLFLGTILLLLGTGLAAPAATAQATPPSNLRAQAAEQALSSVARMFQARPSQAVRRADAGTAPNATEALRQLALHAADLPDAEQAQARAYLARPTSNKVWCTTSVCVHWYTGLLSTDAPDPTDSNGDGVPDYVELVAATVAHVQQVYRRAGFRPAEPDGTAGGNSLPDVYLQDLGSQGLYGYCTTDATIPRNGPYDVPAYCALDNDYAEFPTNTPRQNLEVTVAHEYFHAVQFAYDIAEDSWLLEATATWAEDEVYDNVNDNLQYLAVSPLADPRTSMDRFEGARPYGDWIFFRYLTERFSHRSGGLPQFMLRLWKLLDGAKGGPNLYSTQGLQRLLRTKYHRDLRDVFAEFSAVNLRSRRTYAEGAANSYPQAPLWLTGELSRSRPDSGWKHTRLDHLTSATIRYVPSPKLHQNNWRLRLQLRLPERKAGSAAVVTTRLTHGARSQVITLDKAGRASLRLPFSAREVRSVDVTLANASTRYSCWHSTVYACSGRPRDDDARFSIRGRAERS